MGHRYPGKTAQSRVAPGKTRSAPSPLRLVTGPISGVLGVPRVRRCVVGEVRLALVAGG